MRFNEGFLAAPQPDARETGTFTNPRECFETGLMPPAPNRAHARRRYPFVPHVRFGHCSKLLSKVDLSRPIFSSDRNTLGASCLRVTTAEVYHDKKIEAEVGANGFIERVKGLFVGAESPEPAARRIGEHHLSSTRAVDQARGVRQLIDRLEEQDASTIMAGCIQFLGLDNIKKRLGQQWPGFVDRALMIAEEALQHHLSDGDIYRMLGDASFQICFESSDQAQARAQVSRILASIEDRIESDLAGAEGELSVDSFVAPVPYARIRDASDPLAALYSSLLEIRDAVNTRAIKRHSIPALRYAGALFQPLWSNKDFGRTMNRCLLDTLAGAEATKYLEEIEELDDLVEALANLDCVVFAKSVEGLHHALGDLKRATIVVPVHFQTLALEQQDFLDIAATLPMPYRRFVLLDVIGVPTATTTRELQRALKTGRTVADRIVLQMSPTDHRMSQPCRSQLWGASISLGECDSEDPLVVQDLTRFAQTASEHGLYSFAYGANTIGKAICVVRAGFDYVCGSAVASTVAVPRPHARFTPLFGDTTSRSTELDRNASWRQHPRFAPMDPNSTVTLPDAQRFDCRIVNVSASGAVVLCNVAVEVGKYLVIGSLPAQIVRTTATGFAVRFLEVQLPSVVEIALRTPMDGGPLLENLRLLAEDQKSVEGRAR